MSLPKEGARRQLEQKVGTTERDRSYTAETYLWLVPYGVYCEKRLGKLHVDCVLLANLSRASRLP